MKIVDKTKNNITEFKNIQIGEVFRWDERLFMKVSNRDDNIDRINAYDFGKYRLTVFEENTNVEAIWSELILYEHGME